MQSFKTFLLLFLLTLLFVYIGALVGGKSGMVFAFILAMGMNFFAYFIPTNLY
jgi:heat shock protein HtpX